MNTKPEKVRKPPTVPPKSLQYNLFTTFLGETPELSNTIELWDAVPKYAISPRTQNTLRSPKGRLPIHEYNFIYTSRRTGKRVERICQITIQPASIKTDDTYTDFYPSTNEELVDEVIRKLFTDQQYGIHDPNNAESWVRFSAQMIRKELKARGKTRSLDEIKQSIEILSKTHISLYLDGSNSPTYSTSILADVTQVTRQQYLNDTSTTWIARLPAIISSSINKLAYRQFNYGTFMSLSSQLARWLHRRLSHSYTNASLLDSYEILFSSIQRDSGLLTQSRTNNNLRTLEAALKELQTLHVLHAWERTEEHRKGHKLIDIKFCLHAHPNFTQHMKAANARLKQSRSTLPQPVDNLPPSGR